MYRLANLVALAATLCTAASASAQPALDRVEEQLRRQQAIAQRGAAVPPAKEPGYLGMVADDRDDRGRGARILEVIPGSPAAKAGLKVNDLITAINDQQIRDLDRVTQLLELRPAGATIIMQVNRDGEDRQVSITLGTRPAPDKRRLPQFGRQPEEVVAAPPAAAGGAATAGDSAAQNIAPKPGGPMLGIRTLPISAEAQQQFNLSTNVGALVSFVGAGSPAEKAGVPLGAAITAVDGQPVDSPLALAAIVRQLQPGRTVDVTCIIRGQEIHKRVTLAAAPTRTGPTVSNKPPSDEDAVLSPPGFVPQAGQGPNLAPPSATPEGRIEELERQIADLEVRVEKLESAKGKK